MSRHNEPGRYRLFTWGVGLLVVLAVAAVASTVAGQEGPPADLPAPDVEPAPADSAAATVAPPQRDLMDVLKAWIFHRRIEPQLEGTLPSGIAWTALPTLSYNPVYGLAFGASLAGGGTLGKGPKARPTALSVAANYSTSGQLLAQFKGDIYTPSGDYLIKADCRYLDTNRATWGLGPLTADQQEFPMEFRLVRAYGTLYRRVAGSVYFGMGYHYDDFMDIVDERALQGEATPFSDYSGGNVTRTRASGVSLNLLGDTRDNIVNPAQGYYLSGTFRNYLTWLGSDKNWQEFWIDMRLYPHLPVHSQNVLAFWFYSWMTFGSPPYLDLPAIGWDTYGRGGRGYLQGRIRSLNQSYIECEYRAQLTRDGLLGAVFFLNVTASTDPESGVFARPDKGGGVGLRVKFNKRSSTNLALDRAWGEQGSGGWFLAMTEVF